MAKRKGKIIILRRNRESSTVFKVHVLKNFNDLKA